MNYLYEITRIANEKFSIRSLKPYQILIMHSILEHEFENKEKRAERIVILPTGTGKSLCFLIPSVLCRGISIIVYPLLALMNDQISKLNKAGISCVCLRGGQTNKERRALFEKLRNGCRLVVTNPETLRTETVLKELEKFRVSLFVVDEAHTIAQWGKTFRPAFSELGEMAKKLSASQILAFTATAGEETLKEIRKVLCMGKECITIEGDADRENIFYSSYPVYDREEGILRLIRSLAKEQLPAIVFCRTRVETVILCHLIHRNIRDLDVRYYHAGLGRTEREKLERWFLESRDGILFATSAYGMGVDKSNIRTVIHYKRPSTVQEYLQESGRAGRDGRASKAYVIISERERLLAEKDQLLSVFTEERCRRRALLFLLGQKKSECSGCDWCSEKVIEKPKLADTAMKMIKKRPFRFDPATAASVLCAEKNPVMLEWPGRTDSMWGLEKENDQELVENSFLKMPELSYVEQGYFKRLYYNKSRVLRIIAVFLTVIVKVRGRLLSYRK